MLYFLFGDFDVFENVGDFEIYVFDGGFNDFDCNVIFVVEGVDDFVY